MLSLFTLLVAKLRYAKFEFLSYPLRTEEELTTDLHFWLVILSE